MIRKLIVLISMLSWGLFSQNAYDALNPFFGFPDDQGLGTSVGSATVAAGSIIPGLTSNPANLGLQRFSMIRVNFANNKFTSGLDDLSSTGFSGLHATIPIHVYQGSLVFGLGINKDIGYFGSRSGDDYTSTEEGALYVTRFGAALEFSKHMFLGAELKYYRGHDEMLNYYDTATEMFKPEYHGFSGSFGFLQRVSPFFQIGGAIHLPTLLWVDDNYSLSSPDSSFADTWEYELTRPMMVNAGAAVNTPFFNLLYEFKWSDYGNIDFDSDQYFQLDILDINREIKDQLKPVGSHHLGFAAHVPKMPVHLYGGYQYLPTPYSGFYKKDRRQAVSVGFSAMLNQQFSLQGSWSDYFWTFNGEDENYRQVSFGVALHY